MKHRGMVLVAVLMVAALATMIAAGLMFRMRAEVSASAGQGRGEQAYEAAISGLQYTLAVLGDSAADMTVWYDNPDLFQNQLVADDGADTWYFTVYGDDPQHEDTVRYGVTDEAGKLNINTAPEETWDALEIMTDELVDALLDYLDADSDVRAEGAEQDYYDGLQQPYVIPNGPLATVEELFLVKGFTAQVVYGEDANFNGLLDPNEDDGDDHFPPDNRDGRLDPGLRSLATVYTSQPNVDNEGRPRIDLNAGPPPTDLELPDETRRFITLYLAEGNRFTHPSELLEMRYQLKQAHKEYPDLAVGAEIASGVDDDTLPVILDRLTTGETGRRARLVGLVNVNTARAEVLATVPGLDASVAQQIVDVRGSLDVPSKATPAWLYAQNLLDADAFKKVAPYVTARSYQFSVRCVGFGVPCGRYRVVEAVLDLAGEVPRIAYLRDISRLGMPFALDPELVERMR
ncbi:MAG TPA: helix-hairpin-helix domain-containing protein [Phycisphaerae bacterium]|nr:helix-hairpin-helix domain-containing protein [Phycisphaerae bacterium]